MIMMMKVIKAIIMKTRNEVMIGILILVAKINVRVPLPIPVHDSFNFLCLFNDVDYLK